MGTYFIGNITRKHEEVGVEMTHDNSPGARRQGRAKATALRYTLETLPGLTRPKGPCTVLILFDASEMKISHMASNLRDSQRRDLPPTGFLR